MDEFKEKFLKELKEFGKPKNYRPRISDDLFYPMIDSFYSEIVGLEYNTNEETISGLTVADDLNLVSEPNNPYDKSAISVFWKKQKLGYLPKDLSFMLFRDFEKGSKLVALVMNISHRRLKIGISIYPLHQFSMRFVKEYMEYALKKMKSFADKYQMGDSHPYRHLDYAMRRAHEQYGNSPTILMNSFWRCEDEFLGAMLKKQNLNTSKHISKKRRLIQPKNFGKVMRIIHCPVSKNKPIEIHAKEYYESKGYNVLEGCFDLRKLFNGIDFEGIGYLVIYFEKQIKESELSLKNCERLLKKSKGVFLLTIGKERYEKLKDLYYVGSPDLFVYNDRVAFFVEVKSENDKLSEVQKDWIARAQKIPLKIIVLRVLPEND